MRRLVTMAAVGLLLSAAPAAAQSWVRSDLRLPQALESGFQVIDTYHNSEGHLFFVLQLQTRLLLCRFADVQDEPCVELLLR